MAITMLTEDDFEKVVLGSDIPVLLSFGTKWCKPCIKLEPILQEIAVENEGKFLICKVDAEKNPKLTNAYKVVSVPHTISFKNGKMHKSAVTLLSKVELLELLD